MDVGSRGRWLLCLLLLLFFLLLLLFCLLLGYGPLFVIGMSNFAVVPVLRFPFWSARTFDACCKSNGKRIMYSVMPRVVSVEALAKTKTLRCVSVCAYVCE